MTDDELDRALFLLPLEEPPVDLRARILTATVARPRLAFHAWEVWLVGTVVAFLVWLTILVATSVPDVGAAVSRTLSAGIDRFGATFSVGTLMWMALGVSFVVWISQLSLPYSRRESR